MLHDKGSACALFSDGVPGSDTAAMTARLKGMRGWVDGAYVCGERTG